MHSIQLQSLTIAIVFELIYYTNGHPRAQPDITSGLEVRQILKCPDSGLPVFFLPGLRTL